MGGTDIDVVRMDDPDGIMSPSRYPEKKPWEHSDDWNRRIRASLDYLVNTQFSKMVDTKDQVAGKEHSVDEESTEVIIIVTHAFFLDPFVKYFSPEDTHKDWNNCAIGVEKAGNSKKWKLVENCSSEHLN